MPMLVTSNVEYSIQLAESSELAQFVAELRVQFKNAEVGFAEQKVDHLPVVLASSEEIDLRHEAFR